MENLWGKIELNKKKTPISILEEQAKYLEEMTNGVVYCEITRNPLKENLEDGERLINDFFIKGESLKNYSYRLFTIATPIELYPVDMTLDNSTFDELGAYLTHLTGEAKKRTIKIKDQAQYIEVLKFILSSERVKNLIVGIISLSDSKSDDEIPF